MPCILTSNASQKYTFWSENSRVPCCFPILMCPYIFLQSVWKTGINDEISDEWWIDFFSPLCQFIFMLSVQDWTIVFLQSRSCQLLLALPSFKNGCLAYSGTLNSGRRKIHEKGVLLDLMLALFSAVHSLCLATWCATGNNALTALVHWPDSVVYSGPPARCSQQAWCRLFQPSNWETQTFLFR